MNDKLTASQSKIWLLTASVGVLLTICGHSSWLTTLLTAAVCGIVSACSLGYGSGKMPKWLCVAELLWLALFLGGIALQSETCWKSKSVIPVIPIVLLLLSAWGAQYGAERVGRVSALLSWLILPICSLVFLAGAKSVNFEWVDNTAQMSDWLLPAVLLLPCLGLFIPNQQTKACRPIIIIIAVMAIAVSVWLDAALGISVSRSAENSFCEYSKSVTLFGVAERFEALVACVLTGSWFSLFTIILSSAYHLAESVLAGWGRRAVWCCATLSGFIMCILHIPAEILAVGNLLFWGFVPILSQGIDGEKKREKKP